MNQHPDQNPDQLFPNQKTVYGPVTSWRFGESLGIDPIFKTSTCSFNCVYCQLGQIQDITTRQAVYVPTEKVLQDFREVLNKNIPIDVITYSGSGEPSLASNLGEMIQGIRAMAPHIPQYILTNATQLHLTSVQDNLLMLDKVIVKLDAPTEELFQLVNRPAPGVTLASVVQGILDFKQRYKGPIEVQSMFMPLNKKGLEIFAKLLKSIGPDVVQLNTPTRPYPLSWHRENRGNHLGIFNYEVRELRKVTPEEAESIEQSLRELTGLEILSIYRKKQHAKA